MRNAFFFGVALVAMLASSCATQQSVDREEPSRLMGKDNDVRLDAQVTADRVGPGSQLSLTWEVQNLRPEPIAVADMVPATEYDPGTQVITIQLGSEVPGNQLLPRLIEIRSGETRTFHSTARINVSIGRSGPNSSWPQTLRVRLSFLKDVKPFEMLIGIPQRAVENPKLADKLFMPWVNAHQFVATNAIPLNWMGRLMPAQVPLGRRGRTYNPPPYGIPSPH